MIRYRAFGLTVESDIPLPGGSIVESREGPPDVTIVTGAVALPDPDRTSGPYSLSGDRLCFTAPGVARYLIAGADRILVEPFCDADAAHIAALLIATALPALLWARDNYALHACALVAPGHSAAIALTAPSGGGKSTLLAEWLGRGASLLADDVVSLSVGASRPVASGLSGGYFLADAGATDRRFHAIPPSRQIASAPLAALILIDRAGTAAPGIERLDRMAALEVLLAARHRPRVPGLIGDPAAHLARSVLLAHTLAIYRFATASDSPSETIRRLAVLAEDHL